MTDLHPLDSEKLKFVELLWNSLHDMAFKDIIRASEGNSKMGAFILSSCFIEYLAGFRYGKETTSNDYKNFIKSYLPMYDGEKLYKDLRCKLVHNYSEGGSYMFTDNRPTFHFKKLTDGKLLLNLENFINDIENAMDFYFSELRTESKLFQLAYKRYLKLGLIGIKKVTIIEDKD